MIQYGQHFEMNPIERFLFETNRQHWLNSIELLESKINLTVSPCPESSPVRGVSFDFARITHIWTGSHDEDEVLSLPWQIIGFDCCKITDNDWQFVLNCQCFEIGWRSRWPHNSMVAMESNS